MNGSKHRNLTQPREPMTEIQQRVVNFIEGFIFNKGYPPTFVEIKDGFGFKSGNSVSCHLKAIERKGYVTMGTKKARSIVIVSSAPCKDMQIAIERLSKLTPAQQKDCICLINAYAELCA
jgi:SOS-response transcriptional repressor LexA